MNHYPDNYYGYGRDASNMQGMGYGGFRDASTMSHRGHPVPDYHGGSYPMVPHHGGGGGSRGMYGQGGSSPYAMGNYGHYNTSGHMGQQAGVMYPYYNSHGHVSAPPDGHAGYGMHQHHHHMGMMGSGHPRHPGGRGANQHNAASPASQEHYGRAYPSQGSPSSMPLQQGAHAARPQVPVPPHPMRQTNTQQNPQEVADNILQMASSYPSNQTVQVPLKNRPAPYHIPRSPHYAPRQDHPHHSSPSPHPQQQSLTSHASPSPTSGVKSPISHNLTPSPGAGILRSPSGQVMSPSHQGSAYPGQATAQSPQLANMISTPHSTVAGMGPSQQYHNHHQHTHPSQQSHLAHQSDSPHYSPCSMTHSPYSASPSAQAQASPYSPHNPPHIPTPSHHHPTGAGSLVSSPCANTMPAPYVSSPGSGRHTSTLGHGAVEACNNPLMSLEKLVMLPETQVVDPKSVVNDACLSTQTEEGPKNVEDPAEWPAESSGHSVGCSGISSSLSAQSADTNADGQSLDEIGTGQCSIGSQSDPVVTSTSSRSLVGACPSQLSSNQTAATTCAPLSTDSGLQCIKSHLWSISSELETSGPAVSSSLQSQQTRSPNDVSKPEEATIETIDHLKNAPGRTVSETHVTESLTPDLATDSVHSSVVHQSDHSSTQISSLSEKPTQITSGTMNVQPPVTNGHSKVDTSTSSPLITSTSDDSAVASTQYITEPVSSDSNNFSTCSSLKTKSEHKDEVDTTKVTEQLQISGGLQMDADSKSSSNGGISSLEINHSAKNCNKALESKELRKQDPCYCPVSLSSSTINSSISQSSSEALENEKSLKAVSAPQTCSKNSKIKEDMKLSPVPCHPPSVLSEVPIITNGVDGATACGAEDDKELDYSNGIHSKVHNGLSALVKSKLSYSRRTALITPCSIAVEASERAACERFALRRNCMGRVTRTSSVRDRNDSTGNGDSDESSENISSSTYLLSRDPQDGSRKRGPSSSTKRNGFNKSVGLVVSSSTRNADDNSNPSKAPSAKNGCASHGTTAGSDDETCYYEGVDNSYDVYLNTYSSEESGPSGDDKDHSRQSKQEVHVTSSVDVEKAADNTAASSTSSKSKKDDKESSRDEENSKGLAQSHIEQGESPTPPCKRLKVSPPSSTSKLSPNYRAPQDSAVVIDLTEEVTSPVVKKECVSPGRQRVRSAEKFRPSILGRRTPVKYPVVVLDKSTIVSPTLVSVNKENSDLLNVSEGSTPQQLACATLPGVKMENIPSSEMASSMTVATHQSGSEAVVKEEAAVCPDTSVSVSPKKTPKKSPKKKKAAKSKARRNEVPSNRQSDVKDSFKSMKFSRTLDLMKANRKREGGNVGPFVRLIGSRSSPKTVSVFAQPTTEALTAAKQGKGGPAGKKGHQSVATVTTVHMVSNFASKRPPMVPSSRTISHKPWVCAFCGHGSSYKFLGDLFGPYFKENEVAEAEKLSLEESKKADTEKDHKQQTPGKKSPQKGQPQSSSQASPRQHRRKSALQPRVSEETAPQPEEIWVHQACAMWSPGVCLVGNKMYGLDEAAKDAAENVCSVCKCVGAILGCLYRGCSMKYHFVCAVEKDCYMDEENLSLLCPKHKEKKLSSATTSKS